MTQLQTWIDQLESNTNQPSLKAEFQVVTPMFIGDGAQSASSIRPPSIKGALRFWWRALNWSRCLQESGSETKALNQLHDEEAEIFGLAAKQDNAGKQQGGQGVFTLKVTQQTESLKDWSPSAGTQYLLGQGLWHFKDKLLRTAIKADSTFSIELRFNDQRLSNFTDAEQIRNSLDDALLAFCLLGGLGSRARKGLGSVSATELKGSRWTLPDSIDSYKETLQQLFKSATVAATLPPFTALSAMSRLDLSCTGKSAGELLEYVGSEMQLYRSWGRAGKVNHQPAEQNFPDDHHQALMATQGKQPQEPPQRAIFGLPHNYFFSSTKGKVDIHIKKDAAGERRASPLLIHIHRLPNGTFIATHLLLPAVFLPGSNPKLEYNNNSRQSFILPVRDMNWQVITELMDRFSDRVTVLEANLQGANTL